MISSSSRQLHSVVSEAVPRAADNLKFQPPGGDIALFLRNLQLIRKQNKNNVHFKVRLTIVLHTYKLKHNKPIAQTQTL